MKLLRKRSLYLYPSSPNWHKKNDQSGATEETAHEERTAEAREEHQKSPDSQLYEACTSTGIEFVSYYLHTPKYAWCLTCLTKWADSTVLRAYSASMIIINHWTYRIVCEENDTAILPAFLFHTYTLSGLDLKPVRIRRTTFNRRLLTTDFITQNAPIKINRLSITRRNERDLALRQSDCHITSFSCHLQINGSMIDNAERRRRHGRYDD